MHVIIRIKTDGFKGRIKKRINFSNDLPIVGKEVGKLLIYYNLDYNNRKLLGLCNETKFFIFFYLGYEDYESKFPDRRKIR